MRENQTTERKKKRMMMLLSLAAVAALQAQPPSAAVAFDSQVISPAGSQAPGEQYIFFGADPKPGGKEGDDPAMNLARLADFSVTAPGDEQGRLIPANPSSADCTHVLAPGGTPVVTGILYNNRGGGTNTFADLATFRITNPAVTSFAVWVLDSTLKPAANCNAGLAFRVNGGEPVAACQTVQGAAGCEFTKFIVTKASLSDVFSVAVRSGAKGSFRALAGLTFAVIPDPATAGKKFPVIDQAGWLDLNKNGNKDAYEDPAQPLAKRVENLLTQMTQEEKIGQLNQLVLGGRRQDDAQLFPLMRRGEVSSYIWTTTAPALRNQFQRIAVQESRLGIPIIFGMDMIHGTSTLFPIALGLSCSFDPELLERAQTVAARESRAEGVDWVFAPMCDLARDPRWGRVAETCGEDPYLSALCDAAQVRGFQGANPAAPDRVAACLKHYVGYSAVTGGRDYNDSEITEWTLRNAHLPSFRAGIQSGALTVMSSFNTIGGIPAVANRHALTEILRDEWGFTGFVVSDWESVKEMIKWGYAEDKADAARLALNAGNDMDMKAEAYSPNLAAEVKAGRVTQATVDEAVRRVLRVKFQVGLFERPYVDEAGYKPAQKRPEDLALARECVTKSTVLLKNTGVLPLSKEVRRVALIGPVGEDHREILGCWTGRCSWSEPTLASALKAALPEEALLTVVKGCSMNTVPTTKTLQDGRIVPDESAPPKDADLRIEDAVRAAKDADVVVMAVGEPKGWTGENASRAFLTLSGNQQALFDAVAAAGKPVVTIVFSGRPLALPAVWEKSAAVLYAWQPGSEAGNGLADLLVGNVAPSARLSMSVPRDVAQVPAYYNRYHTGRPGSGQYRDAAFRDAKFWFGYGLTYTTFEYSPVRLTPPAAGRPAEAVVTITNTGTREGVETAQLYIRQMVCHAGARPEQELRGFKRLALKPGEKADVVFPLTGDVLGFTTRDGKWQVDEGEYQVWIVPQAQSGTPFSYIHDGRTSKK